MTVIIYYQLALLKNTYLLKNKSFFVCLLKNYYFNLQRIYKPLKISIMKTFNENASLIDFAPWSGATDTKQAIINAGKVDEFDNLIKELYPDGLSETQLNDILWFEFDWCFEMLGISEDEDEDEDTDDDTEEDDEQ